MSYSIPTIKGMLAEKSSGEHIEDAGKILIEAEGNLSHIYRTVFDLRRLCDTGTHDERVDRCVNHDLVDGILDSLFDSRIV